MTRLRTMGLTCILCLLLLGTAGATRAQTPDQPSPQEVIALVQEHNQELSSNLRLIRREIAALRAELDQPGIEDVLAGIGYIFGLFGVAAFVAARRKE